MNPKTTVGEVGVETPEIKYRDFIGLRRSGRYKTRPTIEDRCALINLNLMNFNLL